jgi:hypothetical protein
MRMSIQYFHVILIVYVSRACRYLGSVSQNNPDSIHLLFLFDWSCLRCSFNRPDICGCRFSFFMNPYRVGLQAPADINSVLLYPVLYVRITRPVSLIHWFYNA